MRIYLATKFTDAALMRDYAETLTDLGHEITSSWINLNGDETAYPVETLANQAAICLEDIAACDTLVSVTPAVPGGLGGRHVEFGLGLAWGKSLIIVGEIEGIFHRLPQVRVFQTWEEFLDTLEDSP